MCATEELQRAIQKGKSGPGNWHIYAVSVDCLSVTDGTLSFLRELSQYQIDRLESINIQSAEITDTVASFVADVVSKSRTILSVRLVGEQLTILAHAALAATLETNRSLINLKIHNPRYPIHFDDVSELFIQAVHKRAPWSFWSFSDSQTENDFDKITARVTPRQKKSRSSKLLLKKTTRTEKKIRVAPTFYKRLCFSLSE
jgi:hypothetical protein